MSPRRLRLWIIVAALAGLPIVGAGAAAFWVRQVADRKWEAARVRIRELTAAHPATLPPPPSTPTSKDLQIHFVAAIREAVKRNTTSELDAWRLVRSQGTEEVADSLLDDAQGFLDRLHQGGRQCAAAPAEFPPGWRGEWDRQTLRYMMNCAGVIARRKREQKDPFEAALRLLDSVQLARFWSVSGKGESRLDALDSLDEPLNELRDILSKDALSPEQCREVERELQGIDESLLPPDRYLEAAFARWAEGLEALDVTEPTFLQGAPYRWRYLLPGHLMKAEAFEYVDRCVRLLLADADKPYLDLVRHLDQIGAEVGASRNPIISWRITFLDKIGGGEIDRRAHVRLLRAAARYRASGEILRLKDPYGGDLLHSRSENRMKFWSVDVDGQDDGDEELPWVTWSIPGVAARPRKDLVIEVPRRQ